MVSGLGSALSHRPSGLCCAVPVAGHGRKHPVAIFVSCTGHRPVGRLLVAEGSRPRKDKKDEWEEELKTSPLRPSLTGTEFPLPVKAGARLGGQPGYTCVKCCGRESQNIEIEASEVMMADDKEVNRVLVLCDGMPGSSSFPLERGPNRDIWDGLWAERPCESDNANRQA